MDFKIKYKPDGSIERYKASLFAEGFKQTYGLDYFEIYAPVVKMTIVRLLIAVTAAQNWSILNWISQMHSCMVI